MSTRSIAFANQKGGVGKTTTAVSLADCLAARGQRTLLLDLDPQGNATSALGQEKLAGGSVYNALLGDSELAAAIRPSGLERLDLIPSEVDLAVAEVDVARTDNYLQRLRHALIPIHESGNYDCILIDCPPSLGILTMNALASVDAVLIPIQCEYFALEGLAVITRVIHQIKDSGANASLDIGGIVLTMFDGRTNLTQQVADEVRKHFGDLVFDITIPRSVRLAEAPSFGQPISRYAPYSPGSTAYQLLADELLKRMNATSASGVTATAAPETSAAPAAPIADPAPSAAAEAEPPAASPMASPPAEETSTPDQTPAAAPNPAPSPPADPTETPSASSESTVAADPATESTNPPSS